MLPPFLSERVEPGAPPPRSGRYVLCWLRLATRAEENPALEVALAAARALRLPVFVYQGLSAGGPHASDRHHTFALQGARELHAALRDRGLGSAFHLERPGDGPVLLQLAGPAALVVADYLPVQPLLRWDKAVAPAAPLWRVDASCVAPVWALGPFDRAFAFRAAARPRWEARLERPFPQADAPGPAFVPDLPFTPVDLAAADLPALVASCAIDHGVSPVHHTPGGAAAGLERWRRFAAAGLDRYHQLRSQPLAGGTSRLSPYLHAGHVSPFRVAREAAARRTDGAVAFLDELLTWRELAWNLCHHQAAADTLAALPAWARETLQRHQGDPRPELPSREALHRAQTGHALWDAAQRQLLVHGELHNDLRMTWGKALLAWTRTPAEALALLFELNDRYALDGRDPASAAGLLWCLGGLDRPFSPELPILGAVRPRPLAQQEARVDVAEYARRTRRPSGGRMLTVAVVGAGVAGAAAARTLADAGHAVTLLDRARGAGGRASTRRLDDRGDGAPPRFDHGVQYFTARDERFARWARALASAGVVARWTPRLASLGGPQLAGPGGPQPAGPGRPQPASVAAAGGGRYGGREADDRSERALPGHDDRSERALPGHDDRSERALPETWLVGVPSMSGLVSHLLRGLEVRFGVEVGAAVRDGDRWRLADAAGGRLGEYDALVLALPAPRAAALIDPAAHAVASRLREVALAPCWAVMAAFHAPLEVPWDAAFDAAGPLRWLCRDSSKPGRAPGERWVLHASAAWSERHLEEAPEAVARALLDAFAGSTGAPPPPPAALVAHRWRHAATVRPLGEDCLWAPELALAACGDWCLDGRLEGAFLSGVAAAGRLLGVPPAGPAEELAPGPEARPAQLRLLD